MIHYPQVCQCDIYHIKQNEGEKISSIDAEKAFDEIKYPFVIKTFNKASTEGIYLNIKNP